MCSCAEPSAIDRTVADKKAVSGESDTACPGLAAKKYPVSDMIAMPGRFPSPVLSGSGSKGFSQRNRTPSVTSSYGFRV
jgi:hypothetical protein